MATAAENARKYTTNDSKHENIVCNHCGKTIDATTLATEKYFPTESIYICKDCYKEGN